MRSATSEPHEGRTRARDPPNGKVVTLTAEQATELRSVLDQVLGDMSTEIADTARRVPARVAASA